MRVVVKINKTPLYYDVDSRLYFVHVYEQEASWDTETPYDTYGFLGFHYEVNESLWRICCAYSCVYEYDPD